MGGYKRQKKKINGGTTENKSFILQSVPVEKASPTTETPVIQIGVQHPEEPNIAYTQSESRKRKNGMTETMQLHAGGEMIDVDRW